MSKDEHHHTSKTRDESLRDLNLLGLWSQYRSDWSSTIKEESQAATNEPIVEEKPKNPYDLSFWYSNVKVTSKDVHTTP